MFKKTIFSKSKFLLQFLSKKFKQQNQTTDSQDNSSFITPTKKSKSNKKNINKGNKINNDIGFVTHKRYAPLENINGSFNSSSGENLLQSEINAATQDQINNNGRRKERKL